MINLNAHRLLMIIFYYLGHKFEVVMELTPPPFTSLPQEEMVGNERIEQRRSKITLKNGIQYYVHQLDTSDVTTPSPDDLKKLLDVDHPSLNKYCHVWHSFKGAFILSNNNFFCA